MDRQISGLRIAIVVGLWSLMIATHGLWLSNGQFPAIPLFRFLVAIPIWVDYSFLIVLAISSLGVLIRTTDRTRLNCVMLSMTLLLGLVLMNQHRLQPWVYLILIQFALLSSGTVSNSLRLMRMVFISVYLYSAMSKIDRAFFENLGRRFVDEFLSLSNLNPHLISSDTKMWLIWLIPLGEFAIGVGLALSTTRKYAVGLSVVMHATLIGILGPWGLDHELGVLIWNTIFAVQIVLLFGLRPTHDEDSVGAAQSNWSYRFAVAVAVTCMILPLFELVGHFDHWPAWSLYSDRTDRVDVFVASDRVSELPAGIHSYLRAPKPFSKWRELDLELWSLTELNAPIYPEDRFYVGVAAELATRYGFTDGIKLKTYYPPNRITGTRESGVIVQGTTAIRGFAESFWLNTDARRVR